MQCRSHSRAERALLVLNENLRRLMAGDIAGMINRVSRERKALPPNDYVWLAIGAHAGLLLRRVGCRQRQPQAGRRDVDLVTLDIGQTVLGIGTLGRPLLRLDAVIR